MKTTLIKDTIQNQIFTIRNTQVMLDSDLAKLYQTETRVLKQAVRRNKNRFPSDFMFELNESEIGLLVSQFVIPSKKNLGGAKPFVFTEQGVTMLASVIKTPIAVVISIRIVRAFVQMRRFLSQNAEIFTRLQRLEEYKEISSKQLERVLSALEDKSLKPKQGVFFNGQVFDAYKLVRRIINSAKKSIILIDNYVNEDTLQLFSDCNKNIQCRIYTSNITEKLKLDLKKYNSQHQRITIHKFNKAHDRFLIIDNKELYHFGASLKDLGKKWFAFSKMSIDVIGILEKLSDETSSCVV